MSITGVTSRITVMKHSKTDGRNIKFSRNIKNLLPYDRDEYWVYLHDEVEPSVKWYGLSFQLPGAEEASDGNKSDKKKFVDIYELLFKDIVSKIDDNSFWTINQVYKNIFGWLPNNERNLMNLRKLFKQHDISNTFKGAILLKKDPLLELTRDLILYPISIFNKPGWLYDDLNISHSTLPFFIKTTHHFDVDILSTNKELLQNIVDEYIPSQFIIKKYREGLPL